MTTAIALDGRSRVGEPAMPRVVISYAREDQQYVRRLSWCLERHGIPHWFDEAIGVGGAWQPEISCHIGDCVAVVVIMTPGSGASSWVRRELILAQSLEKPILPLLLKGEPFWTLGDLNYESVIGGREPSASFIATLRRLVDDDSNGCLKPAVAEPGHPEQMPSSVPMDIADLSEALGREDWLQADQCTYRALLSLRAGTSPSRRPRGDWLLAHEVIALPCSALHAIDRAWSASSGDRFGFSSQVSLWRGQSRYGPMTDYSRFEVFADVVGWRRESNWVHRYQELQFTREAPAGHLPTLRTQNSDDVTDWWWLWKDLVCGLFSRFEDCASQGTTGT